MSNSNTIQKQMLKSSSRENLLRFANYLGLKSCGDMSHKQLWKLIWWRIKDRRY